MRSKGLLVWALICLFGFSACGGGRHVSESLNNPPDLGISSKDNNVEITLNYVVVPNGQGAWTEDAVWDEYVLTIKNISGKPIRFAGAQLINSKGLYINETGGKGLIKNYPHTGFIPVVGSHIRFGHDMDRANVQKEGEKRELFTGIFSSNATISGSVFFSTAPNPRTLIIEYVGEGGEGKLEIPLGKINGLHESARNK